MHQEMGRPSLLEAWLPEKLGRNERLERIDEVVDWERLGAVVAGIHASGEGWPSYPPLMLVKILLLEQWYGLSAPQMEEALADRISFRRFVGLGLAEDTPDHSTLSRFRAQLERHGVSAKLFAATTRTRSGQKRQAHFGYKLHAGMGQGSGLVRQAELTSAKVAESTVADQLVSGDEEAVYGDRAYESKERRAWLRAQGIADGIMHRSHKNQRGLPEWQRERNAAIKPIRAAVERVFGTLKRSYGYRRVRYRGLGRNTVEMWLKLLAYNLRKLEALTA